ncbi:MAG TPA: MFS transporter [bacterium]|nr:MFS transporter [bacterium]
MAIFSLKEEYFIKPDKVTINFSALRKIISESLSYGFKNNKLMSIILFLGFTSFVFQPLNMYWPLILKDNFSFPENNMGIIFALITAFSYAGVQFSKFFQKKFKELKIAIILSQVITFIGIFGSCFFFKLPLFLSFFLLHEFGRGIREPLARAYLNDCINNKNRATVLSLQSMVVHLGSGFGLIISGIIAKNSGELNSWLVSAIILFFIIIIFWWKKN